MSKQAEYSRRYRERHPERAKASQAAFRENNKEYNQARLSKWHRENVNHVRERQLRKYGLTLDTWETIFEGQGWRCACCGRSEPGSKKGWCTDHDHATGRVRGILCHACNVALGWLGDNAIGVREACERFLRYLGEK